MKLGPKLSLLLAGTITLPLVIVLAVLLPRGSAAVQAELRALFGQDARALALECQKTVLDDMDALSLAARTLRLPELDAETREQALVLLFNETRGADVIGLFDERGQSVVPAVRFETLSGEAARDHEIVDDLALAAYSHHVPLGAALDTGLAVGPVYAVPDSSGQALPRVVLAAKVPDRKWVLAMELSLRPLLRSLREFKAGTQGEAFLVDARNKVIAHRDPALVRDRADLSAHPLLAGDRSSDLVGAVAAAPLLGWKVVVQEPSAEALGPLRSMMRGGALLVLLALFIAVLIGLLAVRGVTARVERLHRAAEAVARGTLDLEVPVSGSDELALLGHSFNAMIAGLRERDEMKRVLALSATLDLQEVLHRLLESLGKVVPFERASVMVLREGHFEVALARGFLDADEAQLHLPAQGAEGPSERAVRDRAPMLTVDGQRMLLPIFSREQEVGGLIALEHRQGYDQAATLTAFNFLQPTAVAIDNARLYAEVRRLASSDPLTGVSNRRHFMQLAHRLFETARRYGQPLSALMMDVDRFKQVNDKYGHAVGDQVLRTIADRCRACLRSADLLGRHGGEEFAMLLPMTQESAAVAMLAERIRRAVSEEPVSFEGGALHVTVSIGVSSLGPQIASLDELLRRADAGLYQAKLLGRNRVA